MSFPRRLASPVVCRIVGGIYGLAWKGFPPVVRIETTNACNAKCVICPHRDLQRPITRMEDGLFHQIVDECAEGGCKEVHLHNFGEPLLDKSLEDRVRYAKQKGIRKVKIFSNGSLLTRQRAKGLIEAGLDEVKISIDGADREEFERIRVPLKYDEVIANIQGAVAVRNEMKASMKILVACCSTTDKQCTQQSLGHVVDGFSFGKIHNWADNGEAPPSSKTRKPCSRLWRTMTVLAGGEVALCCLDYEGRQKLGQIDRNTTLRDVWHGEAYRRARWRHTAARQGEIDLCNLCTKAFL